MSLTLAAELTRVLESVSVDGLRSAPVPPLQSLKAYMQRCWSVNRVQSRDDSGNLRSQFAKSKRETWDVAS